MIYHELECPYCMEKIKKTVEQTEGELKCPECNRILSYKKVQLFEIEKADPLYDLQRYITITLQDIENGKQSLKDLETRYQNDKEYRLRHISFDNLKLTYYQDLHLYLQNHSLDDRIKYLTKLLENSKEQPEYVNSYIIEQTLHLLTKQRNKRD